MHDGSAHNTDFAGMDAADVFRFCCECGWTLDVWAFWHAFNSATGAWREPSLIGSRQGDAVPLSRSTVAAYCRERGWSQEQQAEFERQLAERNPNEFQS